jgi:hypothetical protein
MSERGSNLDWPSLLITIAIMVTIVVITYFEVDSAIQRSQIRNLQRRVGQLEEQVKR